MNPLRLLDKEETDKKQRKVNKKKDIPTTNALSLGICEKLNQFFRIFTCGDIKKLNFPSCSNAAAASGCLAIYYDCYLFEGIF